MYMHNYKWKLYNHGWAQPQAHRNALPRYRPPPEGCTVPSFNKRILFETCIQPPRCRCHCRGGCVVAVVVVVVVVVVLLLLLLLLLLVVFSCFFSKGKIQLKKFGSIWNFRTGDLTPACCCSCSIPVAASESNISRILAISSEKALSNTCRNWHQLIETFKSNISAKNKTDFHDPISRRWCFHLFAPCPVLIIFAKVRTKTQFRTMNSAFKTLARKPDIPALDLVTGLVNLDPQTSYAYGSWCLDTAVACEPTAVFLNIWSRRTSVWSLVLGSRKTGAWPWTRCLAMEPLIHRPWQNLFHVEHLWSPRWNNYSDQWFIGGS